MLKKMSYAVLQGGNQFWMLSKNGEVRRDDACLDYSKDDVVLYSCHGSRGNQEWRWEPLEQEADKGGEGSTGRLRHATSGKCLAVSEARDRLVMVPCRPAAAPRQTWRFGFFNRTAAAGLVH